MGCDYSHLKTWLLENLLPRSLLWLFTGPSPSLDVAWDLIPCHMDLSMRPLVFFNAAFPMLFSSMLPFSGRREKWGEPGISHRSLLPNLEIYIPAHICEEGITQGYKHQEVKINEGYFSGYSLEPTLEPPMYHVPTIVKRYSTSPKVPQSLILLQQHSKRRSTLYKSGSVANEDPQIVSFFLFFF